MSYTSIFNKIKEKVQSIPVPTITPTLKKEEPVFRARIGEGMTEEQTQRAEEVVRQPIVPDVKVDYPSAEKTVSNIYKSIKKQFTPREEAVPVRRAFEKEPIMTKAPPVVTGLADLGFWTLEAIPRAGATFYGEVLAPDRKKGEVDIGIDARRLGYEDKKYPTAAQEFKNKVDAGENPWIAGLDVVSNKTLDVAFGAQLFANLAKNITTKLVTGAEDRVLAKQTVDAFKKNQKQLFQSTKNLPLEQREKVLADLTNAKNQAEKILAKKGAPTILDKARLGTAKYTEIASRQTPLGKGFVERFIKPDLKPSPTKLTPTPIAGELPGMRERPGQAPGVGLSLREMESVGGIGGKPLTFEQRKLLLEIQREALSSRYGYLDPILKYVAKRVEFKGRLPEVLGDKKGGLFRQKGDQILDNAGGRGSEEIRADMEEYLQKRAELKEFESQLKNYKKDTVKEATQAREKRLTDEGYIKPAHLKMDSNGRPLAYTAREKAILQKAQELPITSETKSLAQIAEQEGFAIPKELQTPKEIKLSEKVYETNRSLGGGKETVKEKIKKYGESVGGGADKIIGVISTRLKNLNPVLKREMRDYEYKLATNTEKDFEKVVPFMKSFKKLPDADFADLDLALKNSDVAKTNQIIKKNGLEKEFNEIRTTLDDLYNRAKEVGFDTPYRGNYFPRQVRDSNKFMEYLEKTNEWNKIDEIIKKKEEELQRYLTNEEKAVLADFSINTGYKKGIEVGGMKERTIDIIDGELNKFYVDSNTALNNYIQSVNEAIESWNFFKKGQKVKIDKYTKLDDTIDAYVFQKVANGVISPAQATELTNILKARFADIGTKGIVTLYKNLSYIDTMGSPISAITQIGDLAFSLYRTGPYRTLKNVGKALIGRSNIKRSDIGIDKIAQEFSDSGTAAKLLSQVFKSVGLTKIDAIGKEALYNSIIDKYRKQALKPTPDFMRRMEKVFGNETSQIIADLKSGQNTENVKMLAFNELLDVQPIKLSEMPEGYLKGGNGRIFYMLKTYTIKLFDVYRNEVFQEMKRNKARGIYNLIKLTSALVLANATADEIKDFILGRETSLKDRTVDNLLRLVGFSKFGIYKARQEGLPSAFLQSILPPTKFLNNLYKDIVSPPEEAKDLRSIQSIPLVGKLYYWWFGRGAEPKSDFPKMPDLPELPDLPKPPKLPKLPKL